MRPKNISARERLDAVMLQTGLTSAITISEKLGISVRPYTEYFMSEVIKLSAWDQPNGRGLLCVAYYEARMSLSPSI